MILEWLSVSSATGLSVEKQFWKQSPAMNDSLMMLSGRSAATIYASGCSSLVPCPPGIRWGREVTVESVSLAANPQPPKSRRAPKPVKTTNPGFFVQGAAYI